jgi:hypothetical protein
MATSASSFAMPGFRVPQPEVRRVLVVMERAEVKLGFGAALIQSSPASSRPQGYVLRKTFTKMKELIAIGEITISHRIG